MFDDIFNQGKFEVADDIYAPDFVNHGLKRNFSLREDQAAVHQEKAAFPDLKMSVELMVAEGDLVAVVWIFRGTHTAGGYAGLPRNRHTNPDEGYYDMAHSRRQDQG